MKTLKLVFFVPAMVVFVPIASWCSLTATVSAAASALALVEWIWRHL